MSLTECPLVRAMTTPEMLTGTVLAGRFKIERLIGSGGMGSVYAACDVTMDRPVAVKILSASRLDSVKRFERECRALAAVESLHTPALYSWGACQDGTLYLVMELVRGQTLEQLLEASSTLPVDEVKKIFQQVCRALTAVHEKGIVHRDIKPSNIMLVPPAEPGDEMIVKLMDFGIARLLNADDNQKLTKTHQFIGSVDYMSPEHLTPREIDQRSDIFSCGAVIYSALAGSPPYQTGDALQTMIRLRSGEREKLPDTVPLYMRQIVDTCLAVEKKQRFASAQDLEAALVNEKIDQVLVRPASKISYGVVAAVLLVLGVSLWLVLWQNRDAGKPQPLEATLADQLHAALVANDLNAALAVVEKFDLQDEFFWRTQGKATIDELATLANEFMSLRRFWEAHKVYDVAGRLLSESHRSQDEVNHFVLNKVALRLRYGDSLAGALTELQAVLQAAKKMHSGVDERRARQEIADVLAHEHMLGSAMEQYLSLLADMDKEPVGADEVEMKATVAVSAFNILSLQEKDPELQYRLLTAAGQALAASLQAKKQQADPNALLAYAGHVMTVPALPETAQFDRPAYELIDRASHILSGKAAEQLEVYAAVMRTRFDPVGSQAKLRVLVNKLRSGKDVETFQLVAYALADARGAEKYEEGELMEEVCRRVVASGEDNQYKLVHIHFHPGKAFYMHGQKRRALEHFRAIVKAAAASPLPNLRKADSTTAAHILSFVARAAHECGQDALARRCLEQFDRIDSNKVDPRCRQNYYQEVAEPVRRALAGSQPARNK